MRPAFFLLLAATATMLAPAEARAFGTSDCRDVIFFTNKDISLLRAELDFWVVVRVLGDCRTERQVTLVRDRTGKITLELVRPLGRSIHKQLENLEHRFPETGLEELCKRIHIERTQVEAAQRDLAALVSELESMRLSPVFEPVIFIHGVFYEVWVGSSLNVGHFDFQGPPFRQSARKEGVHPLDAWSQKLLNAASAGCEPEKAH